MRLKLVLTIALTVIRIYIITAQTAPGIQWQKTYGGSNLDYARSIQQTTDGGYIVTGSSASQDGNVSGNHGSWDVWILKLNSTGIVEWKKSLGGSRVDGANDIIQTADGGYIIAGYTGSSDGDVIGNHGGNNAIDLWIVKLSNFGDIQWQKNFGGDRDEQAYSIQQTTDGGYIIAGTTNSLNGDVTGTHGAIDDYWVLKLSNTGDMQWQKTLGGSDWDWGYSITQTTDSGYIVAGGSRSSDGDITMSYGNNQFDFWIVKLNSVGNIQWQKSFGGTGGDIANCIRQTADSGYIVAGRSYSTDGDVTGNHQGWDYWVLKLSKHGNIQWQKSLGGSGGDEALSIEQTTDYGYIVAGFSVSSNGDISNNYGGQDCWLTKLNEDGDLEWQKNIGGISHDKAYAIKKTADGGYIFAGTTEVPSANPTPLFPLHDEFFIVKLGFSTVPIKLITFSSQNEAKDVLLKWQIVDNPSIKNFEIQRSQNGTNFTTIGIIGKTNDNSNVMKEYSFKDNAPLDNISYYRLKVNSNDGHFEYSRTLKVLFKKKTASFIYPNPANSAIHINTVRKLQGVRIVDANGKTISYLRPSGNNEYNVSDLANGNYWVELIYENGCEIIQLNKK